MVDMRKFYSQNGITLVELLLAFVIIIIGSGLLLAFMRTQSDATESSTLQGDVRMRAQIAVEAMSNELRAATRTGGGTPPNLSIPAAPGNTSVTFYLPQDGSDANTTIIDAAGNVEWGATAIIYSFDAGNQQIYRTEGGTTTVIASNVSSVTFSDQAIEAALASDEVRMRLTLQEQTPRGRTLTSTAVGLVKLRN